MSQATQVKRRDPFSPDRRERPGRFLIGAVGIQNSTAKCTHLGVTICKLDPGVQRAVVTQRIGIQDENEFAPAGPDPYVVSLAESEAGAIVDQTNARNAVPA